MKIKAKYTIIILLSTFVYYSLFAQNNLITTGKGQLSAWSTFNFDKEIKSQLGSRFIPTLNFDKTFESELKIDAEISLNTNAYLTFEDWKQVDEGESFKPYRLWARFSGKKWEVRAGLQKINFGSATILRPLMWFDQLDPRDPLQLTNGIYGLLGRYYFKNNANLWFWMLYGNEKVKGWEFIPSECDIPEFGGRFQFPLFKGEFATSFHHRTVNSKNIPFSMSPFFNAPEYRIGLDGKWDKEIGFWFETSFSQLALGYLQTPYSAIANLGADYTIGVGNGINIIFEQLVFSQMNEDFKQEIGSTFSTLSMSYPIGLMDRFSLMVYYDWTNKNLYRFINFQRSYDSWSYYLIAFWNPDQFQLYNMTDNSNLFAGKGIQLMAVYNF